MKSNLHYFASLSLALAGLLATSPSEAKGAAFYDSVMDFPAPANPSAPVTQASDGKLYGVTQYGGAENNGTIFRMNLDGTGFEIVHSFTGGVGDGLQPRVGVIEGSDGFLYGTTEETGYGPAGIVYKVQKDGSGFTVIKEFSEIDDGGWSPRAPVIEGSDGALYGTCYQMKNKYGNIFKLNRDGTGFTVLHSFGVDFTEGTRPAAGLLEGSDGKLYGTASGGGNAVGNGGGTVFRLNKDGSNFTALRRFTGSDDGNLPMAGLIEGSDGFLYGTTHLGGPRVGQGTIFKLKKDGSAFEYLHSFGLSEDDGRIPYASLVEGRFGYLFGTTAASLQVGRYGNVFRIKLDGSGYLVLHHFPEGEGDGLEPRAPLILASDGKFYGTTADGGEAKSGNIFKLRVTYPPITGNDLMIRNSNQSQAIGKTALLANDLDPQGSIVSLQSVDPVSPKGAPITDQGDSLHYGAPNGMNSTDSFTYTVSNQFGDTAVGNVTVVVGDAAPQPSPTLQSTAIIGEGTRQFTFTGAPNQKYSIEAAHDLNSVNWQAASNVTANGAGVFVFDDTTASTFVQKYFRVLPSP